MVSIKHHERGALLPVRARAGARRNGVMGARQGELLVSVTQAPERGKANHAIVKVLAEALRVRAAQIEIVSGKTSPHKQFLIVGASAKNLSEAIAALLPDARGDKGRTT